MSQVPRSANLCWTLLDRVNFRFANRKMFHLLSSVFARENYFNVFTLPLSYELDTGKITKEYRERLKQLHPDKFHQKPQDEQEHSESQSRLINQAYNTLKNPYTRGLHMLELQGLPLEEDKLDFSSEFLMEVYDINDELSETKDSSRLQQIKKQNDTKITELTRKITAAFEGRQLDDAKRFLAEMKYLYTISERIKQLELELGIVQ